MVLSKINSLTIANYNGITLQQGEKKERRKNRRKIILTLTNCNTSSSFGIIESSKMFSLEKNMKIPKMKQIK